ncbi:MAG: carbohydrate kinase family protein [Ignavibacterium sp.]|uniref:carbohydrate kinase family protein n=1 Tax=Ignavibacterium sp. TaxID=2651167 RepID=UPI00404B8865
MKILLIGHSVFDTIVSNDMTISSPGGIFYSARQMLLLSSNDDELFLLTQFDNNTKEYFLPVYSKFNCEFLEEVYAIPAVKLIVDDKKERKEIYANISSKLNIDKIDFSKFDAILINMITGNDINPDDLKFIRTNTSAVIFFDVHTLSRSMNENGERVFTIVENFSEWAKNIDILQANENEFNTLGKFDSEYDRARNLLQQGVKIILLTKGVLGAKIFYLKNQEVMSYFISANKIIKINTVGCGDVFGASFFYNYIRSRNVYQSLSLAINKTEDFLKEKDD